MPWDIAMEALVDTKEMEEVSRDIGDGSTALALSFTIIGC